MLNITLSSIGGEELKLPSVPMSMSGADFKQFATEMYPVPDAYAHVARLLIGGAQLQPEKTLQDQGVRDGEVVTYAIQEVSEQEKQSVIAKFKKGIQTTEDEIDVLGTVRALTW